MVFAPVITGLNKAVPGAAHPVKNKIKKKFKNIFFIILNVALSDSGKIQENKILLKIHVGIEKDQF